MTGLGIIHVMLVFQVYAQCKSYRACMEVFTQISKDLGWEHGSSGRIPA
jgi:hypothetical protein